MLDPEIAKKVLSQLEVKDRESLLDAVKLGMDSKKELETWALFCACLAWGGLIPKRNLLIPFYRNLRYSFTDFVMKPSREMLRKIYKNQSGSLQLLGLCLAIGDLLEEYGSISGFIREKESVDQAIFGLAHTLRKRLEKNTKIRFNLPKVSAIPPTTAQEKRNTKALKRYCVYFRWMVRDSEPDFGIWEFSDKRNLYHPVDRHVARIMKRWRVLPDDSANWLNVEKVTEYFKTINPNDPLKFDYHLVTFGQKFCRKDNPLCSKCPIEPQFRCKL